MDITVTALAALITQLASGAAGEAGKAAFTSLVELVRRRFGREPVAVDAEAVAERPKSEGRGLVLAESLDEAQAADPEFAGQLRDWIQDGRRAADGAGSDNVHNEISGEVRGSVVQARDITGNITFGQQPRP